MPAIYLPKNESVFRCKVGYALAKSGQRARREFRLYDFRVTSRLPLEQSLKNASPLLAYGAAAKSRRKAVFFGTWRQRPRLRQQ